jgi:hypothetical protein
MDKLEDSSARWSSSAAPPNRPRAFPHPDKSKHTAFQPHPVFLITSSGKHQKTRHRDVDITIVHSTPMRSLRQHIEPCPKW